jgi:hypothetical protein
MTTATATPAAAVDAYDAAMAPPPPPSLERTFFGQVVIVDPWFCALIKGVGKVPFDPNQHDPSKKAVAVKISIECQGQNSAYSIDQDVLTSSKEWREFTLPSLQAIGKDLRSLANCYVQAKRVPTGERYQNKTTGEWKDRTAIKFVAVYPDADTMKAAADVFYTPRSQREAADQPAAPTATYVSSAAQAAQVTPTPSVDRATAAQFLPSLWIAGGQDKQKFWELVRTNPMLAPYFADYKAPEMVQYVGDDFDPAVPF